MTDNISFAIYYTILMLIVSVYYYHRGKVNGIKDVLMSLREEEPELSKSFIRKLEKKVGILDAE